MSLFGNLGGMLGNLIEQHGGAEALMSQALQRAGGVQGVLGKLQQAGLGDQVQSWIGTGPNQPVTPDNIASAIGHGKLGEMASHFGVQPDQLSHMIASALPGLVDRMSPHGVVDPSLAPAAPPPAAPAS